MGTQTQWTIGSIKASKKHAMPRLQRKLRREMEARRNRQRKIEAFFEKNASACPRKVLQCPSKPATAHNLNDAIANISCRVCKMIAKKKLQNPDCKSHKRHDDNCPLSRVKKKKRKAEKELHRNEFNKNLKTNNTPLQDDEKCKGALTTEALEEFFASKKAPDPPTIARPVQAPNDSSAKLDSRVFSDHALSAEVLSFELMKRMKKPTARMTKGTNRLLPQAKAVVDHLMTMLPSKSRTKGESTTCGPLGKQQLQAHRKFFPPGTMGFKVPPSDKSTKPDFDHSLVEGTTFCLVRWDLNVPDLPPLKCPNCNGALEHSKFDFTDHGTPTPVQDVSGTTSCSASMMHSCKKCDFRAKANDGRIFNQVPSQCRRSCPVDPRHAVNCDAHLSQSMSRMVEKLMLTYGNGDMISGLLHEMIVARCENLEEDHHRRFADWKDKSGSMEVALPIPPLVDCCGNRMGLTGDTLRDRFAQASASALTPTNLSDDMRCTREIQGVGCKIASSSDHTFAAVKNCVPKHIDNAKAIHTIIVETGEIASAAAVQTTAASDFAHQLEQFARRANVRPKMHVTDNCPTNSCLLSEVFDRSNWKVVFRLGLFHWAHRISSTLNDRHPDCNAAVAELSRCMHQEDERDVADVKKALKEGRLGTSEEECDDAKVDAMHRQSTKLWKSHRNKCIRVWTRSERSTKSMLEDWCNKHKKGKWPCDPKTFLDLCTDDTKKAVDLADASAKCITDVLPKSDLYESVEPPPGSKTDPVEHMGNRGVESKLESFHLRLAHFSNRGSGRQLVDSLSHAGMAQHNQRVRHKRRLRRNPDEKAFSKAFPSHTNHSCLRVMNDLAKGAGVEHDVHENLDPLPPDNGERFMSQYWEEQKKRNNDFEPAKNGRCTCRFCSTVRNPCHTNNTQTFQLEKRLAQKKKAASTVLKKAPPIAVKSEPMLLPKPPSIAHNDFVLLQQEHLRLQMQMQCMNMMLMQQQACTSPFVHGMPSVAPPPVAAEPLKQRRRRRRKESEQKTD